MKLLILLIIYKLNCVHYDRPKGISNKVQIKHSIFYSTFTIPTINVSPWTESTFKSDDIQHKWYKGRRLFYYMDVPFSTETVYQPHGSTMTVQELLDYLQGLVAADPLCARRAVFVYSGVAIHDVYQVEWSDRFGVVLSSI